MYVTHECIVPLVYSLMVTTDERINSLSLSLLFLIQAKQLKDYENAVIAKRMEELDEDELQALVEEVERDDF
jgi:hypothetical protein